VTATPVLEISDVRKNYSGLRPLRIRALAIAPGERVAVSGFDAAAAQLVVNLVTGASLPDEGTIRVLGRSTADIATGDEWLASLDRFGIMSDRAVLLEGSTLAQNLAMPFTLEIDPIEPPMMERVAALAAECGIAAEWLTQPAGGAPPEVRARAHFARAVALGPELLVLEHPTATVAEADRRALAADLARACDARRVATLAITQDEPFARAFASRFLTLNGATGELREKKRGWF
jgi:ABC-type sulfate/molybdate transport systems ATPase subunit